MISSNHPLLEIALVLVRFDHIASAMSQPIGPSRTLSQTPLEISFFDLPIA
jgi:hypothetical protein